MTNLMTGYKVKKSSFFAGGVENLPVKPSLPMGTNDDIMDQNLGAPVTNLMGAQ